MTITTTRTSREITPIVKIEIKDWMGDSILISGIGRDDRSLGISTQMGGGLQGPMVLLEVSEIPELVEALQAYYEENK